MRSNRSMLRSLAGISLLLALPLFKTAALAQSSALGDLLAVPGAAIPEVAAPAPAPAETYPGLEQDRKPGKQLSNAGGSRVLGDVRFERDAKSDVYRWGEMRVTDAGLEEAYWGFRSAGVGHNFLMFKFKDGAKLVVEALPWKKKGEEFKPFGGGINGAYALVWNLVEWNSFIETAVGRDKLYVDVYPLKLSREEKLRLLDEAVKEAVRDHSGEKYHTFNNSCSTNALLVFGRATGHRLVIAKLLPSVVVEHLKLRGFLGGRLRSEPGSLPKI